MSTVNTTVKNAQLAAVNTQIGNGAFLQIWSAAYAAKLVEWEWTGAMFDTPASGAMSMLAPDVDPIAPLANGTPALARIVKADGTTIILDDITVGTTGTEIIVPVASVVTTQNQDFVGYTWTMG